MAVKLWVPGPLPGLNELLAAAKSGRGKGNAYSRLKRQWSDVITFRAMSAKLPRFQQALFTFHWHEPTKRRDPDNIAAGGRKLILDGLVSAGILPGDGWKHVLGWSDVFTIAMTPGVDVTITGG